MNSETAKAILTHYDLPDARSTFLGRSENATFRVETSTGETFLLRLHIGIDVADYQPGWREPSVIQSELLWLDAIAHDTALTVPQPVQNRSGEWITYFDQAESPIVCSVLRWVEGNHLENEPTSQQARQLGSLMAQLHQHSSNWALAANFSRPTHDIEQLQAATVQLGVLVQNGIMSAEHYQVFERSATQVQELISTLGRTRDTWGLIHADLHQGNYILHGEEIRAIDFSRCGFGFYLYDIGQCLGDLDASLRSSFFEGYTSIRELPADYQSIVEAFFNGATVENFAFHSDNPKEYEFLSRAVPYVVENHLHAYLNGQSFLFQS